MGEVSKYQVAIAAVNQVSGPVKAATASLDSFSDKVKVQSAEVKKLNAVSDGLAVYQNLNSELSETSVQMNKVKVKSDSFKASIKNLSNQTLGLESAAERSQNKLSNLESQLRTTERPTKALKAALRDAKKEFKSNTTELRDHQSELAKAETQYKSSRREVNQLAKHYDKQRTKLHTLKAELKESGIHAHKFSSEQRRIKQEVSAANAALEKQKLKLNAVRSASAKIESNKVARSSLTSDAVDLAMKGAAIAVPIKLAMDFESSFADVKKAVNDASEEELAAMKKRIVLDAPKLGVSKEGLSAIIAEGGRNGIKKEELFDFAEAAAKMSVAFDMTADEAGASMMKWRTTMNLSQDQAVNLANAVNYVGDNMATNAADITDVLVRQGAVITNSGLDEIQAASLSAAVLSGSANKEMAATATKNLLLSLTAGDAATGTQADALSTLGFDPSQLAKDMQDNAPKAVEEVLLAIKDQDKDVQTSLMKNLFGSESIGSIAPLLKNIDNFRKAFKLVEKDTNFAGSMQKEFEIQAATGARKVGAFVASISGLATVLGESLLPAVGHVLDVVTPAVSWLTEAAMEAPTLTAALMAIPAALIAVKTAVIAFKAGKLLLGQGKNYSDLGKAKLGMGLDGTASSATKATNRLARLNSTLDRLGRNSQQGGGYQRGGDGIETKRSKRNRSARIKSRRRGGKFGRLLNLGSTIFDTVSGVAPAAMGGAKGKWGKRAAVLGGGTALSMMTANANAADLALMGADAATIAGDVAGFMPGKGLLGAGAGIMGKAFRPLNIMLQGAALTSAIENGNATDIGATAGDMAGGLGGAALGATIGTAILPGIGTVIGGAIGGIGGGEIGSWLGEKVASIFSNNEEDTLVAKAAKIETPPVVTKRETYAERQIRKTRERSLRMDNLAKENGTYTSKVSPLTDVLNKPQQDLLPSSDAVSKMLTTQNKVEDNRKIEFNLTIPPSSGSPQADEDMLNRLVGKIKEMMMSDGVMGSGELSVALDGSLSDRSIS